MKIGLFDSGLGGLVVTNSLIMAMPEYDYVYFGDTARVPYGNRSQKVVYEFTKSGVNYLFSQGCQLIIIACNTASAEALRKIQQEYLPQRYPDRKVIGVLIPAAEEAVVRTKGRVGVIATEGTVASNAYEREIHKINPSVAVYQQAAPLLVPMIESGGFSHADPILRDYIAPLLSRDIDTLVLGCTHYPILKPNIEEIVGENVAIISQDELVAKKLREYLDKHPEVDRKLTKNARREFYMSDIAPSTHRIATQLFGEEINIQLCRVD